MEIEKETTIEKKWKKEKPYGLRTKQRKKDPEAQHKKRQKRTQSFYTWPQFTR